MKLKEKLAKEYSISCKNYHSPLIEKEEDFRAGFEKAREVIANKLQTGADWAFEGFNQGDKTIQECMEEERLLSRWARRIRRLGEEEVQQPDLKSL